MAITVFCPFLAAGQGFLAKKYEILQRLPSLSESLRAFRKQTYLFINRSAKSFFLSQQTIS